MRKPQPISGETAKLWEQMKQMAKPYIRRASESGKGGAMKEGQEMLMRGGRPVTKARPTWKYEENLDDNSPRNKRDKKDVDDDQYEDLENSFTAKRFIYHPTYNMYLEKARDGEDEYRLSPREQRQANSERKRKTVQGGGNKRNAMLAEIERQRWQAAQNNEEPMRNSVSHGDHEFTTVTAADNPYTLRSDHKGRVHSDSVLYDEDGNNLEPSRASMKAFRRSLAKARGSRRPLLAPDEGPNAATGGPRLVRGDEDYKSVGKFRPGELVRSSEPEYGYGLSAPGGALEPERMSENAAMHARRAARRKAKQEEERLNRAWVYGSHGKDTDEDGKPDSTAIRDKITPEDKNAFNEMSVEEMGDQLRDGGTHMAANFTKNSDSSENNSVVVTKSSANKQLIADMMARQFGYSPQKSLNNMADVVKSKANLHAVDNGNTYELHQLDSGSYIVSPLGYGSVGNLALQVPSQYEHVFETELSKSKLRAELAQRDEMRKSFSEVDSKYHYRRHMDLLLGKTYRLAKTLGGMYPVEKAQQDEEDFDHDEDDDRCPKCGGAMENRGNGPAQLSRCSNCGYLITPNGQEFMGPTAEQRRAGKKQEMLTRIADARRARQPKVPWQNKPTDPPIVEETPHEILKQSMQRSLSSERRFFKAVALYADAYPNDPYILRYLRAKEKANQLHKSRAQRNATYEETRKALSALRAHIDRFIRKALGTPMLDRENAVQSKRTLSPQTQSDGNWNGGRGGRRPSAPAPMDDDEDENDLDHSATQQSVSNYLKQNRNW